MRAQELVKQNLREPGKESSFILLLEAYQNMDHLAIDALLNDDLNYEDTPKIHFIDMQKKVFQEFKTHGDTYLNLSTTICTRCKCNRPLVIFTGNHSGLKYAVYFEFTEGEITDIFHCVEQSDYFDCIPPF